MSFVPGEGMQINGSIAVTSHKGLCPYWTAAGSVDTLTEHAASAMVLEVKMHIAILGSNKFMFNLARSKKARKLEQIQDLEAQIIVWGEQLRRAQEELDLERDVLAQLTKDEKDEKEQAECKTFI